MFMIIATGWIVLIGLLLIVTYVFYEKFKIFKIIGDVIIGFSFVKRDKLILLSYGILTLFIGLMGFLMLLIKHGYV